MRLRSILLFEGGEMMLGEMVMYLYFVATQPTISAVHFEAVKSYMIIDNQSHSDLDTL